MSCVIIGFVLVRLKRGWDIITTYIKRKKHLENTDFDEAVMIHVQHAEFFFA